MWCTFTEHNNCLYNYTKCNTPLEHLYLGVEISKIVFWKHHINNIKNKTNKCLNMAWLNFTHGPAVWETIYKSFVRPHLGWPTFASCCHDACFVLTYIQNDQQPGSHPSNLKLPSSTYESVDKEYISGHHTLQPLYVQVLHHNQLAPPTLGSEDISLPWPVQGWSPQDVTLHPTPGLYYYT